MCKIAEYTDEMQMFYETKAQAVLMSCYDDQRNMAVFQAFCESEPCVGNNSENHGKMVHVKPKCLGEGLGSMRVQSVHVTHVLAEWHFSLCVSVRLPQSVRVHCTHSRRARKKTSQLRPPQSTGKSSPYTWQVLAAMQIKPQSFKDKLSWAFMFVSITAPLLLLAQEVAFSFPLSTMHPASCLFSVIFYVLLLRGRKIDTCSLTRATTLVCSEPL